MKYLFVLCCVMVAVLADEKYTTKYDNTNIDEILENDRLLNNYFACLMDRGKCPAEGKELKEHIHDAITTGCAKCSETQEKGVSKVIRFLIKNKPEMWRELADKYDPEGKWRKEYEDRARAEGIEIPK